MVLYPIGTTKACLQCSKLLENSGFALTDHPSPEVTHLLLDAPSFAADGSLRGGGQIENILSMLPPTITVIGGNLSHTALHDYRCMDLLLDAFYLANNAAITADCAIKIAAPLMPFVFAESRALVIGWGRIGKCLAKILSALGADVTIAARKERDRAMAVALGFDAVDIVQIPAVLPKMQLLFNTVPAPILDTPIPSSCIALELASRNGICGENILIARGLPGKYAPESAAQLMCTTILRKCKEDML